MKKRQFTAIFLISVSLLLLAVFASAAALKTGDVVVIPANTKHWHGAKKNSWFSHLSVEVPGDDTHNEWLEPVRDAEYEKL